MSRGNFRFPAARATVERKISRLRNYDEEIFSRAHEIFSPHFFHLVSSLSIRGTIRLNERTKSRGGKTFIVEEVKNDRKTNDGKKVSLRSYLISATGIRF